jgi:AcrR family transcriptional regulator
MVLPVKRELDSTPAANPAPSDLPRADAEDVAGRVLDAAEELFYTRGIQAVGMDDIRDRSGVALKRLYQTFPSKETLVVEVLARRDARWRAQLSSYVSRVEGPDARILAVFDWLGEWFAQPGFRGCAWINSNGELGGVSTGVADQAKRHKSAFKRYLGQLIAEADLPPVLIDQIALLAEGAMTDAGIFASTSPAAHARTAAETLLRAAPRKPRGEAVTRPQPRPKS